MAVAPVAVEAMPIRMVVGGLDPIPGISSNYTRVHINPNDKGLPNIDRRGPNPSHATGCRARKEQCICALRRTEL